jgi:hypothetical protein
MTTPDLSKLIVNRRWVKQRHPFAFMRAQNVFTQPFYESLAAQFEAFLAKGFGNAANYQFGFGTSHYQARSLYVDSRLDGPLSVFLSREWHDMLAELFGIDATRDIQLEMHHHPRANGSGWPHNDLNPGWFCDAPKADGITVGNRESCTYGTGKPLRSTTPPRETVRAVAVLFYLANPPWAKGDGGETGLYVSPQDGVENPTVAIPPINNSLLAFECTPYSYHSFIHNRKNPRNSIIMWLHRPKEEVLARWGNHSIVYWGNNQ